MTLRSENVIFSLSEKLWTKKYPSRRFNHLSMASAFIWTSNIGISKLICTLKGTAPSLKVDPSATVEGFVKSFPSSCPSAARRIPRENFWNNLMSIHICFLPPWKVSLACESGCPQKKQARDSTLYTLTSSRTCTKNNKEQTALIPMIQIYQRNKMKTQIDNINTKTQWIIIKIQWNLNSI